MRIELQDWHIQKGLSYGIPPQQTVALIEKINRELEEIDILMGPTWVDDHNDELLAFMLANPDIKSAFQMVARYMEAHPVEEKPII